MSFLVDIKAKNIYNVNVMKCELKNTYTGEQTPFKTVLEYGRYEGGTYFNFDCENSALFSAYDKDNEPIYKGDVVELFICTSGDRRKYYEIEVAPNGTTFFAKILNENGLHAEMLDRAFDSKVIKIDGGYRVEIRIPDKAICLNLHGETVFNAYRIETEGGTPEKNLLALNPTLCGSFHMPQFFIPLDVKA